MMVREDILADLTTEPVTKIMGKPGQGDINLLEQELAEEAAEMKTTVDVVEKGKKFVFFVVVLGQQKYGAVICKQLMFPPPLGSFLQFLLYTGSLTLLSFLHFQNLDPFQDNNVFLLS